MDGQFKELRDLILDMREHVDVRFNQIDAHFNRIDTHLHQIDARLNQIDERLNQIDERDRLLRAYIVERFTQMHAYIDERFTQMHEYVDERTRDMETRLLKGFQKWAASMELAVRPLPIRMGSIEERLSMLEERWREIGNQGV